MIETHLSDCIFVFINQCYDLFESPVYYKNSFIAIEIYICMTSMMMLEISMEVSVNIELPLKGRAQAWLGLSLSWTHLGTF